VILDTNTIVDPWAVMVESLNTVTTNGTVSTSSRSDSMAVRAKLCAFYVVKHVKEVNIIIDDVSWRGQSSKEVEHQDSDQKTEIAEHCPFTHN